MALAEALKNNTSADHFQFDATDLEVECVCLVLLSLAENKTLKSFHFKSDKLSDSLSAMSDMLCANTSIEWLTICGEKLDLVIDENSMLSLGRGLQQNKTLKTLSFTSMTLRPKEVEHLCDALRRRTVETLLRFTIMRLSTLDH